MNVKMRYVKHNLRRRRAGKKQTTFSDFYHSMSDKEINTLKLNAEAADNLRNAVFYFKQRRFGKAMNCGFWVLFRRPGYLYDKVKHNLIKR